MKKVETLKHEIAELQRKVRLEEEKERARREYSNLKRKRRNLRLVPLKKGYKKAKEYKAVASRYYGKARKKLTPIVNRGYQAFGFNNRMFG